MRLPIAVSVVMAWCLAGCSSSPAPKLEVPPPAPVSAAVDNVGKGIGAVDSRVAAAVVVARELNKANLPAKVDAELSVAAAYLPVPSEGDLAVARLRSEKASTAEYDAQLKKAQEKQKAVDAAWKSLEAAAEENKRAIAARDARITDLEAEVDRAKKDASQKIWTITGAALAVLGALSSAFFGGPKAGIPILLSGCFAGAVPFMIESPWFAWIAAGTGVVVAALGAWWLFDRVRDDVNEPHHPDAPPKE